MFEMLFPVFMYFIDSILRSIWAILILCLAIQDKVYIMV